MFALFNQKIILLQAHRKTLIELYHALQEPLAHVLQTNQAMMSTNLNDHQKKLLGSQAQSIEQFQEKLESENISQINMATLSNEIRTALNGIVLLPDILLSQASPTNPLNLKQVNYVLSQKRFCKEIIKIINQAFSALGLTEIEIDLK